MTEKKLPLKTFLLDAAVITLGAFIYAVAFVWCFEPNDIACGGITGLAQVVHRFFDFIPVGGTVIVFNIPLFLLGWKLIGGRLLVSSLYAMAVSSVIIDALNAFFVPPVMEPLLAAIFGGVGMGFSLGLIFLKGATTGGTDLAARLLKLKLAWLPMGKLLLVLDLASIALVALCFRQLNTALYGVVAMYISSLALDGVLYGMDTAKVAYIISERNEAICAAIVNDLDRGVTILHGQGAYTGNEKKVLMCAFKQREIASIRATVKELDPDAFLIVCNAHEVLGEGFRAYKKDDL